MTVDAIICYHNHEDYLEECLISLKKQVRQAIVVNDGSSQPIPPLFSAGFTELRRERRHSPANSFNYGAFHSNADWLLYVDPHCTFKPNSIKQMVALAGDEYEVVMGTGPHILVDPTDPWAKALQKADALPLAIPLTFMMTRSLWEIIGGIPEPPYAHMDVLANTLKQKGIMVAEVRNMCTHAVRHNFMEAATSYFQAGFSYGVLERDGYIEGSTVKTVRDLTEDQITLLVKLLFTSAYQLGALTGLAQVPQKPLKLDDIRFDWVYK